MKVEFFVELSSLFLNKVYLRWKKMHLYDYGIIVKDPVLKTPSW